MWFGRLDSPEDFVRHWTPKFFDLVEVVAASKDTRLFDLFQHLIGPITGGKLNQFRGKIIGTDTWQQRDAGNVRAALWSDERMRPGRSKV
jgi:hypothetical protein